MTRSPTAKSFDLRPDLLDDARDLRAGDEGEGRPHLVLPLHHEDVEEVAAGGAHADTQHAAADGRRIDLLHGQLGRLHPAVDDDGTHGAGL